MRVLFSIVFSGMALDGILALSGLGVVEHLFPVTCHRIGPIAYRAFLILTNSPRYSSTSTAKSSRSIHLQTSLWQDARTISTMLLLHFGSKQSFTFFVSENKSRKNNGAGIYLRAQNSAEI